MRKQDVPQETDRERPMPTRPRTLPLALAVALPLAIPAVLLAAILRVVPSGGVSTGDCSSWDPGTACRLAYAVNTAASSGDEIWVEQGVYHRGTVTGTFKIKEGVQVYGGFLGTETLRSQRATDPASTILTGDIDGDDVNTDGNHVDETPDDIVGTNAYHVVTLVGNPTKITNATVLDGFTITGGDATGATLDVEYGGGLSCDGGGSGNACSPKLENLRFVGNRATVGGGAIDLISVNSGESAPKLTAVSFESNRAGSGGAVLAESAQGTSAPTFEDVDFLNNAATSASGVGWGGGAYFNEAAQGDGHPAFTDVRFEGNTSQSEGGAFYDDAQSGSGNATFERATFIDNSAQGVGGAIYIGAYAGIASPLFTNVTFSANDPGVLAIYYQNGASDPRFVNCTLADNTSAPAIEYLAESGGTSSHVYFTNVISWNGQYSVDGTASACTIENSIIEDGAVGAACAGGQFGAGSTNLTSDPLLLPLADNGGRSFTYALDPSSPAIGSGDATVCATPSGPTEYGAGGVDQRNYVRGDALCDIGAYESDGYQVVFEDGFESGDTSAWSPVAP